MGAERVLPRKVLLGVTGGIAAYKTPILVRALVKAGAQVQVVMTAAAHDFVSPLVLSTLSKRPALTELVDRGVGGATWNDHVYLARWADLMLIAPATANTISKMAHGLCDDLLLACWLSAECPVFVAPAMDLEMFKNPVTRKNIETLRSRGVNTIGPDVGELASGLSGEGRMTEPDAILDQLINTVMGRSALVGKKMLITAGPTHEAIDPVRFIANRSSGKMGFAIAEEAAARGAHVELITGPVELAVQHPRIRRIDVTSAAEMAEAAKACFPTTDVAILSAAVADWRPARVSDIKMKKQDRLSALELEPTEDILAWMGGEKKAQLLVGFALETSNERHNAEGKLERKNLDLIVLNSLNDPGAGFGYDTNKVTLIDSDKNATEVPLSTKADVAIAILDRVEKILTHAK